MDRYKNKLAAQEKKRFYKYSSRDYFFSRDNFFMFFAKPLSMIFYKLGFTANFITLLSGLFSIIGGLLLTLEKPLLIFFGMFFFISFYLLDYCDGIVARLRNEDNVGGLYMDLIMHIVNGASFAVGISFGSILSDGKEYIPFALLTIISVSLTLNRFSIGWMAIAMRICEDKKANKKNQESELYISKVKKSLFTKGFIRLGSFLFHEDYFIFTVTIILFINIFYNSYYPIDIRTFLIIYGAIIYFPAMLMDIIFYSEKKLKHIFIRFNNENSDYHLPDFIYFKDN